MANAEKELRVTTKNDLGVDCISRQEVLRLLANSIGKTNTYLQTAVLKISSVTPQEPKTGHWLGDSAGYKCDKCGHDLLEIAHSIDYIDFKKPKYCPNCGAKMIEPQESEEV